MPEQNAAGQAVTDPTNASGANPAQGTAGAPNPANTPGQSGDDPQRMVPLPALHEAREEIKLLKAEMESLRAMNNPALQQQQYGNQYQQRQAPQQEQVSQQLEQLWDEDPRRAMQTEVMMALNWYDSANAELDTQEQNLGTKYPDFEQYRSDIRRYLRSVPVADRARPGMVESAYYFVKGRGADSALKAREEEILRRVRAGESVQGINSGATASSYNTGAAGATPAQESAARAMGIPVENYMKGIVRKG